MIEILCSSWQEQNKGVFLFRFLLNVCLKTNPEVKVKRQGGFEFLWCSGVVGRSCIIYRKCLPF